MGLLSFFNCSKNSRKTVESEGLVQKDIFIIPYFGEFNLNQTNDKAVVIDFKQSKLSIDLNFENDMIDKSKMESTKIILNDLDRFITIAYQEIKKDFESDGAVKDYFDHHNEVVSKIERNYENEEDFLKVLKVYDLAFYPEEDNHYAVFWFSIGTEITNYNIVVRFTNRRNFHSVDFVS